MSILIVEDNAVTARIIASALQKHGYDTAIVHRAKEAMEFLQGTSDVSAAIVDLGLPEVDGTELVDWIRSSLRWSYLPIVICSASRDPGKVRKLGGLGCRHYSLKPFTESDLIGKLQAALDGGPLLTELRAGAMRHFGLDIKAYQDIASLFSRTLTERIAAIDAEFDLPSAGSVIVNLYDIDETAVTFGLERLHAMLQQLPKAADGQCSIIRRHQWNAFREEADVVRRALRPLAKKAYISTDPLTDVAPAHKLSQA